MEQVSLKGNALNPPTQPIPVPAVVDYRDTVAGTYIGNAHVIRTAQMYTTVILDTIYIDTLIIANSSPPDKISFNGQWATLNADYTFHRGSINTYFSGINGEFTFNAPIDVRYLTWYQFGGNGSSYEFTGTKQ